MASWVPGPTALAIPHSGAGAVALALHAALEAFTAPDGSVTLSGWYRAVSRGG